MNSTTSISSSCLKKISCIFLNRLKAIFTLQAFVLAMSISTATADVDRGQIHLDWLFPFPDSEIPAQYVTTTLLPQLIGSDDQLRQRLGFSSLGQINNLLLPDRPFVVLHVGLSRLKNYDASSPFSPLFEDKNWFEVSSSPSIRVRPVRFLFPIRESSQPSSGCNPSSLVVIPSLGCIASSVQVKRLSGTWEFQQIGRPGLIKKLTHYGNGATHFVLWIPVLNLHYLATLRLTDIEITAITDDHYVKDAGNLIKAGDKLSGRAVFMQLKNVVQTIDANSPPG